MATRHQCNDGKADALCQVAIAGKNAVHDHDNILSARFFARKTTDEAAILTASEIMNKTMPMKNST